MRRPSVIYQCVTNDLSFDQRLLKKARALKDEGYAVRLIGRRLKDSPSAPKDFKCHRFSCWFNTGVLFYLEFNIRLFLFLLFTRCDVIEANDADTLLGCGLAKIFRGKDMVYDSHELFTEVPELKGKTLKRRLWHFLQKWLVPHSHVQLTVGPKLAQRLTNTYGGHFVPVRNIPEKKQATTSGSERIMIYQGALNPDRGVELAIEALVQLKDWKLWIAGGGPLEAEYRRMAESLNLKERVVFLGRIPPEELHDLTCQARVGLNLLRADSLNYYYSLANKFFDYVQARIPGISMAFPEYTAMCKEHRVAILLEDYTTTSLVGAIRALQDDKMYAAFQKACQAASDDWIWSREAETLIKAYSRLPLHEE